MRPRRRESRSRQPVSCHNTIPYALATDVATVLSGASLQILAEIQGDVPLQDDPSAANALDLPTAFAGGHGEEGGDDEWEEVEDSDFSQAVRDLVNWR